MSGSWQPTVTDSFWVIGPRWACKMGRIFPPDERRWVGVAGPAKRFTARRPGVPITGQMSQICTSQKRQTNSLRWEVAVEVAVETAVPPELRYLRLQGVCSLSEVHLDG